MNICILQNVPFEGAGTILPYFQDQNRPDNCEHQVDIVHLYREHRLPEIEGIDLLIIMGGPMSVQDEREYPYLREVKQLVRQALERDTWILGICLGAQLIADVLGAEVKPHSQKEIGWYPVSQTPTATDSWLSDILPCEHTCLHWHGDTFAIPEGAVHIARSRACENQAFVWNRRVIGLQFHLEFTPQSTRNLIDRSTHELVDGPWIQRSEEMLADSERFTAANRLMAGLLQHIEAEIQFQLHPQLAADCHILADFECARVLLHKNAAIPWFILVPRGDYRDLDDLPPMRRHRLLAESDRIAALLREEFGASKINVAALGNMVPQLHLHVIGRHPQDSCWPNPVWGNLTETAAWDQAQIERLRSLLTRPPPH